MSSISWFDTKKRRVVWDEGVRAFLARKVARSLLDAGYDTLGMNRDDLADHALPYLQAAIGLLEEGLRREIARPSEVPWLIPEVLEVVRAHQGLPSKFRADVLERVQPLLQEPPERLDAVPPGDSGVVEQTETYDIQGGDAGVAVVPERDWVELQRQVAMNTRMLRRLLRGVAALEERVDAQASESEAFRALVFEALPHLAPPEEIPAVASNAPVVVEKMPLIVVAGLHPRDREAVNRQVGERAEIVFESVTRRHDPASLGECDWLIATAACGTHWLARARQLYAGRFTKVNSMSGVVREIRRLRGGG